GQASQMLLQQPGAALFDPDGLEQAVTVGQPPVGHRHPVTRETIDQNTGQRSHPRSAHQIRRNTRLPLVPPKPKELDTATSSWRACASRPTQSSLPPSPGLSRLMVGGAT